MCKLAWWYLHCAYLPLHVLLCDKVVLELSTLTLELFLYNIDVAFNYAGTWVGTLVGHPAVAHLVLALVLLPAEVMGGGVLQGVKVALWAPLPTQRALLHTPSPCIRFHATCQSHIAPSKISVFHRGP